MSFEAEPALTEEDIRELGWWVVGLCLLVLCFCLLPQVWENYKADQFQHQVQKEARHGQ